MVNPPPEATPEEYHCTWYKITDKISYLPGLSGTVSFHCCFHDLQNGLQTHNYAPTGLDIKERWTVGGNSPGEPIQPAEIGIGAPVQGLYLREDVEMRCNILMTRFVKKVLKDSLKTLVARLMVKSQLQEAAMENRRLYESGVPLSPPLSPPLTPGWRKQRFSMQSSQSGVSEIDGVQKSPGLPTIPQDPVEMPT